MLKSDAIVLGGGAAGLFCAMQMGQRGRRVVVLEHNQQVGRKILISGGGRCNFTNRVVKAENFLSENPHFAKSALARYQPMEFIKLVEKHGIAWHEKTLGQLFCDGSAAQIVAMLEAECAAAGVKIVTGHRVASVEHDGEFVVGEYRAPVLVVATGGLSIPKMGATGLAFDLARQFGLRVVAPRPALVPFEWPGWGDISGVAMECIVKVGQRTFRERMLFTHRGVSGPAILQISSYWKPGETLELNLAPGRDVAAELIQRKRERVMVRTALVGIVPNRLAERLVPGGELLAEWTDKECRKLGEAVHRFMVAPVGTEGYDKAEVTAGGVDTAELSSTTMEAKKVPGLYFIGEAVDVTGWLGGYNFQWAWASGHAAGTAG
ncbi:MAG: NAD(P)/FAD-dependent oxidoreductase [Acidobacteria bacterium]|nr:NAD(P)/FAD-dependent oxidoreductase [Acidobacteriota bacterium]